jgi:hypothetical protein
MRRVSNHLLAEISVPAAYAQVVVQDAGTGDLPDWTTGDERVVHTAHAVYVATRPDHEGEVRISVFRGGSPAGLGTEVFNGTLTLNTAELEVGSPLAARVHRMRLGEARAVPTRIFVRPPDRPAEEVLVLLDPAG